MLYVLKYLKISDRNLRLEIWEREKLEDLICIFGSNVLLTQLTEIKPGVCPEVKLRYFLDEIHLWNSYSASLYYYIVVEIPSSGKKRKGKFDARW